MARRSMRCPARPRAIYIEVRLAFRGQAPAGTREVRVGGRLPDVRARSAACAVGRGVGVSGSTDEQNTGRLAAGGDRTGERRWARCCKGDGGWASGSRLVGARARARAASEEESKQARLSACCGWCPSTSPAALRERQATRTCAGRPRNLVHSPASGGSDGAISELGKGHLQDNVMHVMLECAHDVPPGGTRPQRRVLVS